MWIFTQKLFNQDDFNNPEQLNEVNKFVTRELNQINSKKYNFKFSEMDAKQAIKSSKTNKSAGFDNLCSELFIYADCDKLKDALRWLFNAIITKGIFPNDFNIIANYTDSQK